MGKKIFAQHVEDGANHLSGLSPISREGLCSYRGHSKTCCKCDSENHLSVNVNSGKVFQCGGRYVAVLLEKRFWDNLCEEGRSYISKLFKSLF